MTELIKLKLNMLVKSSYLKEYTECIGDLLDNQITQSLDGFIQHGSVTSLDHSLSVSYYSFIVCKLLHLDYCSAARGGLLHDLFLYDWHKSKVFAGMHTFSHPHKALENASRHFDLNKVERDIIVKHMWPVTIIPPKYKESFIVSCMDKYCAILEVAKYFKIKMASMITAEA